MNKKVSMADIYPVMQESLNHGAQVSITVTGTSMLPMLHDRQDTAVLKKPQGKLKRYDLPLYRRKNGAFVLHRVVKIKEGVYIMCGDNQTALECGITDEQVIAVVESFVRNGKEHKVTDVSYKLYSRFWPHTRVIRRVYRGIKRRIAAYGRKLFG